MNSLNELFDQILQSEQSFRGRLNKLRELSSQVQDLQLELKSLREQAGSAEGELVLKNQKLADAETEARMMRVRRDVLALQAKELQQTQGALERSSDEAAHKLSTLRQEFVDELREFSHAYDLCGLGNRYREDVAKRQIKHVQSETLLLEAELTKMELQKDGVEKLQKEVLEAEFKLWEDRRQEQDLKDSLVQQEMELKELELEKKALEIKFGNDPELIKIQHELASCLHCLEEEQCRALEKELEDLQRQCYQKQMRQQLTLQQRGHREGAIQEGGMAPPTPGTKRRSPCGDTAAWAPGAEERISELQIVDEDWLDREEEERQPSKLKCSVGSSTKNDWLEDVGLSNEELESLEREVGGSTEDDLYLNFDDQNQFREVIGEERLRSLDTLRKKDSLSSHTPNGTLGFSSADVNESNGKVQNPTFRCRVQHVATQRWAKPEQASDCSRLGTQNAPQWELQRKKPGESIIKAPGHQPRPNNNAKKVRFHY